jgi:RNA polymerase sigma-70 factor (ECF subfamily)
MEIDQATELFESRRPRLQVYIRAIIGSRDGCDDILQEAAMICLRKCAEVPDATAFEGWIRKVCRFEALKHLERHRKERPAAFTQLAELAEDELDHAVDEVAEARLAALRTCLATLAPTARDLVQLRYVENCPGEEIARRLGRPINTVYVTLCRLHRSLAECVRRRLGQEAPRGT